MAFEELANDRLTVEKPDGQRFGPYNGVVSGSKVSLLDDQVDIVEGDFVLRELPNGRTERFVVEEANFSNSPFDAIPSSFELRVRKASMPPKRRALSQTINVGTAGNLQIGDYNTQNVVSAVQELVALVESRDAPEGEKEEAKALLRRFLEHPLVSAAVGAGLGGLLGG